MVLLIITDAARDARLKSNAETKARIVSQWRSSKRKSLGRVIKYDTPKQIKKFESDWNWGSKVADGAQQAYQKFHDRIRQERRLERNLEVKYLEKYKFPTQDEKMSKLGFARGLSDGYHGQKYVGSQVGFVAAYPTSFKSKSTYLSFVPGYSVGYHPKQRSLGFANGYSVFNVPPPPPPIAPPPIGPGSFVGPSFSDSGSQTNSRKLSYQRRYQQMVAAAGAPPPPPPIVPPGGVVIYPDPPDPQVGARRILAAQGMNAPRVVRAQIRALNQELFQLNALVAKARLIRNRHFRRYRRRRYRRRYH